MVSRGKVMASAFPALDPADEVDPGQDIPPLVVAPHLQGAVVFPEEGQVIIGLEELVVEFDEGQALFEPDLVGLGGQHPVDAEVPADIPQKSRRS